MPRKKKPKNAKKSGKKEEEAKKEETKPRKPSILKVNCKHSISNLKVG